MQIDIRIQTDDFDQGAEYGRLATGVDAGAVVTFVGRVREFSGEGVPGAARGTLWLEHYAGMTEKVLRDLIDQAAARWELTAAIIVHRIGHLRPGDQIVFVGVSAAHRQPAFAACEYLMDFLKTQAPFWKREGEHWVAAKESDQAAAEAWEK